MTNATPIAGTERSVALDALRGIALFGVLTVNLLTAFRVSLFQHYFMPKQVGEGSVADHVVARVVEIGLESKAFILFSFLFGVGLAAQRERTEARGARFSVHIARRLAMLLGLGLMHLFLVWNGDILTLYALVGILAAPLLGRSKRFMLLGALTLFVLQALPLPFPPSFASPAAMMRHIEEAHRVYGFGTFGDALAFRVREVGPISSLLLWSAPRTLGLFLLGAWAWRVGVFVEGERRNDRILVVVLALGVVGGALVWATHGGVELRRWRDPAALAGSILLALGYGAAVLRAFRRPLLARALGLLAPLGRMALTSYLTQSLILGALFYGWGFGLFDRLGEARALGIGLTLFVVQAVACTYWLKRHRFGPVEWLWRSFTYGAWQPMRR